MSLLDYQYIYIYIYILVEKKGEKKKKKVYGVKKKQYSVLIKKGNEDFDLRTNHFKEGGMIESNNGIICMDSKE